MTDTMVSQTAVGAVANLTGQAQAVSESGTRDLSIGSEIFQGDTIVTEQSSNLEISFLDDTSFSQGENSRSTINTYVYNPEDASASNLLLEMTTGVFRTVTGEIAKQNPDNFKLKSPMALIGIRGTVVNSNIGDGHESIGVETIGKGHVLVVQDSQGNIQFISDPMQIMDILAGQPFDAPRNMTRQELRDFQEAAPNGVDMDPARQAEGDAQAIAEAQAAADAAEQAAAQAAAKAEAAQQAADEANALKAATEAEAAAKAQAIEALVPAEPEGFEPGEDGGNNQNTGNQGNTTGTAPGYTVVGVLEVGANGDVSFFKAEGDGKKAVPQSAPKVTKVIDPDPTVNNGPTAVADKGFGDEDGLPITIKVLGNDTDPENDTLRISSFSQGANGSVAQAGDSLVYTAKADFNGTDSFTYIVSDGKGGTSTGTVTVTVAPRNDNPVAANDTVIVQNNASPTPIRINVLDNDGDIDGDSLSVATKTNGSHGTVAITTDGHSVTYTPDTGYYGSDSFAYTVSDGNGGFDAATVFVTVNAPPTAVDDTASTNEDTAVPITVLDMDTDLDGGTLRVTSVTDPGNGSVVINSDNTVTYTPDTDYNGLDSFNYTISDGNGGTDTGTVNITVDPVEDIPIAQNDTVTTNEDTAVAIDVLGNDSDGDGDSLSIDSFTQPTYGTASVVDGKIVYSPTADYNGSDSLTYTVDDGKGNTDTATVNITVDPVNDVPVANTDFQDVYEDNSITINVLSNDTDTENDTLVDGHVKLSQKWSFKIEPLGN